MERKCIGSVGVDSGQLIIMDPAYVNEQWEREGDVVAIRFWGAGQGDVAILLKEKGYAIHEKNNAYEFQSTDEEKLAQFQKVLDETIQETPKRVLSRPITNGTYDTICDITQSQASAGSLPNDLGVAFQTGFGDGLYEVYATYQTYEMGEFETKRISKVEIILIEE